MRGRLRELRARIDRRARAWIKRRQGLDADPSELRRQRIYILPTRLGVAYGAMLFAMLLGGMNYNNNLGLALTFLLVSLGLVTMHHCHGTLTGIRLRLLEAVPGFAGGEVRFRWPSSRWSEHFWPRPLRSPIRVRPSSTATTWPQAL
jgi:hypothetical protein